tara:strand:- start:365 stop:1087 length:723 start_codon:yes stop_codon:yes gene_type:complete
MIISIETSSSYFSITLLNENNIMNQMSVPFKNELSEIIVPTIKFFLQDSSISLKDISFLAVGCGPGSFTGIRTVISTALGIKISYNYIKTIGVNSLAGLAMSVLEEAKELKLKYIISSIDSKRDDLFLQFFKINYMDDKSTPFFVKKDISTIKIDNLYKYIIDNKLILKDILFVGHQFNKAKKTIENLKVSRNLKQEPNSLGVGQLASYLIRNRVSINKTVFAFDKFQPVYVRSPQINIK